MLLAIMRTRLIIPGGPNGWRRFVRPTDMAWLIFRSLFVGALLAVAATFTLAKDAAKRADLWSFKPLAHAEIPRGTGSSTNAIDAFIGEACRDKGLAPMGPADRLAWLRRVTFDLVGLPPSVEEQENFLGDESVESVDKVVERLLASQQHGVQYGRHWLDVLRYTDQDENMPAAPGIHLWRDWVISALNQDLPYDEFVRAQICGNRAAKRRIISALGFVTAVEPRPEDLFALGFLARGATSTANTDQQLAMSAVETISSAFLGMTVGCAKCHDHFYDPIAQTDYYSMKALFDPLVLRRVELATVQEVFAQGRAVEQHEARRGVLSEKMRQFIAPYHDRLYQERLALLPDEVQAAIRKPEKERTVREQKVADDYYPVLRIDPPKIKEVMPAEEVKQYEEYLKQINELKPPQPLPAFWTVEEDARRAGETNYVLTTGDPTRPIQSQPVQPGYPFAQEKPEFREGRRETFADWLTAPENPLFARVAVNRIWQWHFGDGLHRASSDFGMLGGVPVHAKLLDWLAAEFIAHKYSMKWLHRLIVTSETYRRASAGPADRERANSRIDPDNRLLWKFPLRRLEAEPIRDARLVVAGKLDLSVGGKSFEDGTAGANRRAAYMARGYLANTNAMPDYLQTFDAEDGRMSCPRRNQTVTAPQALFMMNNELVEDASGRFAERLKKESGGDVPTAITMGFGIALGRPPSSGELAKALDYVQRDPARIKGLAWLLLNMDEFLYVR